jgi:hypothetical protein
MATPLDLGLLDTVGVIFPILLVAVVTFAIFSRLEIFGKDRRGLDALVAIILAVLVFLFPIVRDTINMMAPWFVLFFFFLLFLAISYMIFGATTEDLFKVMQNNRVVVTWILAFGVIFFLGSLSLSAARHGGIGSSGVTPAPQYDEEGNLMSVAEENQQSAFWATIVHPKVLGLALIMLIATVTVARMSTM